MLQMAIGEQHFDRGLARVTACENNAVLVIEVEIISVPEGKLVGNLSKFSAGRAEDVERRIG